MTFECDQILEVGYPIGERLVVGVLALLVFRALESSVIVKEVGSGALVVAVGYAIEVVAVVVLVGIASRGRYIQVGSQALFLRRPNQQQKRFVISLQAVSPLLLLMNPKGLVL